LWSAGRNEIYILRGQTRLDIINARKPAKKDGNDVSLENDDLWLVKESLEKYDAFKFSTHLFQSGAFWEQSDFRNRIEGNSSPHDFLLSHLMTARDELRITSKVEELSKNAIDKLLVISILIKFLEDIKDDDGKHTLNDIYKKVGVQNFIDAIKQQKIIEVLDKLSNELNGELFSQFSDSEKTKIQQSKLQHLGQFLDGDIEIKTQQKFIWKQYDFRFLPPEVISAIYENFTGEGEKGVVYTPIHLVNLMIDEVMPLDNHKIFENKQFRVLDPACGSGVFLVAAYKRLLQWWFINNNGKAIDNQTAKEILEDNIFGIDVEEMSVLVSILGLTTTFLDHLSPKEVWNNLKFKNLKKKNILKQNLKDWIIEHKNIDEKYDLIIGNPPFNESTERSKKIPYKEFKEILNFKYTIPGRNKIALIFLETALFFGKKACMIIPSNVFLYNKSGTNQAYREQIFTNYTVEKIYDFTHLRRDLFHGKADTPVLSLIINNQKSEYQPIEHIVVNRQFQSEQKIRFEIDNYDKHLVPWQHTIDENLHFVWKTNLLGGGQLFHLIYRLSLLRTLVDFLEEKELLGWEYNNGYIGQYGDVIQNEQASFLNGHYTIKPKSFKKDGTFKKELISKDKYFWRVRNRELFTRPLIVFQLVSKMSRLPMGFVENGLCFNSSFVGISAPKDDREELLKIYNQVFENTETAKLCMLYMLSKSPKSLVYHETSLVKEDIDNLPFPKSKDDLQLSETEQIIQDDVLNYYRHLAKSLNKGGEVLHETLNIKKSKYQKELQQFGEVYCDAMNEIYETENQNWQIGKVTQTPNFTIYRFGFGNKNGFEQSFELKKDDSIYQTEVYNNLENAGVRFARVVRYYKHEEGYDIVEFIKPNTRKYWLKSIALRDVGNTYMDFKNNGY
jgi:hypothetical protein